MKEIPLTRGKVAIVDDEVFEQLNKCKWLARKEKYGFYAGRNYRTEDGRVGTILMHRLIASAPAGMEVHHINNDGLDNRRKNLKICSSADHLLMHSDRKSGRWGKGVSYNKAGKKWRAYIAVNGEQIHLGLHATEAEAMAAREAAKEKIHKALQ